MINAIIIFAITLVLFLCAKFLIKKDKINLILKILAITLFTLGIVRCFLNDNFIWVINGGTYGETYYKTKDILQSLLRWGTFFAYVVYPCAVFFKARVLKNFAIYFCMPVAIVATFFYNDFMTYFITDSGRAIMTGELFRHIEFSLELIITILVPLMIRFCTEHKFNVKDKKEWINFFILLPLALIIVVPVTLPQSLFGFTNKFMVPFTLPHFLWIAIIFALLVIIYFAYRFKDYETRYMICVFLALYLFLHYNSIYLMDFVMSRLPFQLCNLGSYLVLIGLLTKNQAFFNFILLANVPGAMIAFCVPDISEGMLSYWNIHFYIEHTWVFLIPLLAIALRIIKKPDRKGFKHFFIGFSIYFAFCAIAGSLINCFLYIPYHPFFNKVNYFYLFNTTVLSVLPFLSFTRVIKLVISDFELFPVYMLLIYLLYSVFCMAFYYVYTKLFEVADDHFKLREIKINMYEEQGRYNKRKKVPQKRYLD